MAGKVYELTPRNVPPVKTPFREINTPIPPPQSVPILESLRAHEPVSMRGQPIVVWDRAAGVNVYDRWGNKWLDWSSGVLVANAGHGNPQIVAAIVEQAQRPLLHHYCFPAEARQKLVEYLLQIAPQGLDRCFLLTTGAETTECAIKLALTRGTSLRRGKHVFVTFNGAFHGRTLGAQLAGGSPALKAWIPEYMKRSWINVPYPGDIRTRDKSFDLFVKTLREANAAPQDVCGIMTETYQGGSASFIPQPYLDRMRQWAADHQALIIMDEIQAGFGRCGTLFGFEHYGFVPDLVCLGKGITSGLPLSAIMGREEIMNQYAPGEMTSTHTGNPLCAAAALASCRYIVENRLPENAARMGRVLLPGLEKIAAKAPERLVATGKGLVATIQCVQPGGDYQPDAELAWDIVKASVERGLLMFSPVGLGGCAVKISPPLIITEEALADGLQALAEAVDEALAAREKPRAVSCSRS